MPESKISHGQGPKIQKTAGNKLFSAFGPRDRQRPSRAKMCLIFVNGPIRPSTKLFEVLAYLIQFLLRSVLPVATTG